MAKSVQRLKAIELRENGESIKYIAKQLQVSPSSVSTWCKDVILTQEQIQLLESHAHDPNYGKRLLNSLKQRSIKNQKIEKLMEVGKKEIGTLSRRELFLIGVALYWAEGFKKDSQAGFANSNPYMINLYLRWLKECFGYTNDDLIARVTANSAHENRIRDIEKYWSGMTQIPIGLFRKPFFQHSLLKKVYENNNEYYGVLRIKVKKSIDFLRKIHGWIEGLAIEAGYVKITSKPG